MKNIKLTIEYDGTNYKGWQIQKKGHSSVQEEIQKALKTILKESVKIIGSGRTDSGVHAKGQVANFKTRSQKSIEEMQKALNANLPKDIAIVSAEEVPLDFHAQYSVKTKTYRYTIFIAKGRPALQRQYCLVYPNHLNLSLMRAEAKSLIGRKDFKSFQSANPDKKNPPKSTTIRNIRRIDIKKKADYLTIDIEANGFLYKMVRNIVGTLLKIGSKNLEKGSVKSILGKRNRIFAYDTAKAKGLTLLKVGY